MSFTVPITVFDNTSYTAGWYRIPAIVRTKNNTLIACCDARHFGCCDNPNKIDKIIRRSVDDGKSWSQTIVVVQSVGDAILSSQAAIDPQLIYDEQENSITLVYLSTPAGTGIFNAKITTGYTKDGNRILKSGFKKYMQVGEQVKTLSGKPTDYKVDDNGNVTNGGQPCGNIFCKGKLQLLKTFYLYVCKSYDEGLTWSKPVCINTQIKGDYMGFLCAGPGVGIVKQFGEHKGRYIVPIYFGTRVLPFRMSTAIIYSDDKGATWHLGGVPNNNRQEKGKKLSCMNIKDSQMTTESQIIETQEGVLRLYMRNHHPIKSVAIAESVDGGLTFENFRYEQSLPQPICQLSAIKLYGLDKPYVLLCNPASRTERKCGTVRLSEDDGLTFPYSKVIREGEFIYSSMVQLDGGNIGMLYEPSHECVNIEYITFNIEDIKEK